ncbi:MAG: alanine-zipper protein [Halochromatium sp.]|uniref:alanine-zipper protein n=1 Tax=Halochromatium sp. TaxID=2049430 RepID=UPI00397E2F76
MSKTLKLASLSAAALLGASLLGGCATDQEARDMAQAAMDAANSAQACCEANEDRINRMYQRVMAK